MAYPNGLFSWADASVPDPEAAKDFYTKLFGWEAEDQFDDQGNYIYTMFQQDGTDVAGLGPQPPDAGGMPPLWNSYVSVDDLESTVAAWTSAGGSVMMPAMDVMSSGRMAVVIDPQGAALPLWQPKDHVGAGSFTGHGAMSWNELATRDSEAAREFYGSIFGWTFQPSGESPGEYYTIHLDTKEPGQPYRDDDFNGGILTMDENWPEDLIPHWMVYFTVENTDDFVSTLEELGGSVSVPPFDTSQGKISVVGDPWGATFSVIAPSQAAAG